MTAERVFFVGCTGNIGARAVRDLLAKNIAVTLYARTPSRIESLFPNHNGLINVVQGYVNDSTPLKEGIKGHTRLFLLVVDAGDLVSVKRDIAKISYEAGVKQIRKSYIGAIFYEAERAICDLPNRGKFVALRPTRFMSNLYAHDRPTPNCLFFDTADANHKQAWISTNDIGALAAIILSEDINDHGDYVYTMLGDVVTPTQRAEIFPVLVIFGQLTSFNMFPRYISADLSSGHFDHEEEHVSDVIAILLGRKPETFEEFVTSNKAAIHGN